MDNGILTAIITAAAGIAGVLISWLTLARKGKKDTEKDGESRGVMASDIGYIKAGVDDLKRESRETRASVGELAERVTRCEESCKQAHKRIDEVHYHLEREEKI